ncbi:unnamed protein product, partial [Staurois parvus]
TWKYLRLEDKRLLTKTFRKPTAANTLLEARSYHPRSLISGIPVGQFLICRRNCSNINDFRMEAQDLYKRFREQGYSHSQIRKARRRAYQTDQKSLLSLKKDEKVKLSEQPVRMITQFGAQWKAVKQILEKHWKILTQCPKLSKIVGERPKW